MVKDLEAKIREISQKWEKYEPLFEILEKYLNQAKRLKSDDEWRKSYR